MSDQRIAELEAENARLRERSKDREAECQRWANRWALGQTPQALIEHLEDELGEARAAARTFAEAGRLVAREARGLVDVQDDKEGKFLIRALVDVIEAAEAWDAALATSPRWLPETESNA